MNSLTINTSTACIAFGSVHLRVYFQDNEGWVRESQWDGSWTGGGVNNRLFQAKPNTPLAAITWGTQPHIRVYYVDNNNILQEHCWDGSWTRGALGGKNIKLDYRSKIAACTWSNTPSIRVYHQEPGNEAIHEQCWDGNGWNKGATLPKAALGSSLAAIAFNGARLRIYYQSRDNMIHEHCYDGAWAAGHNLGQGPAGTAIAAITWGTSPELRVYFEQSSGNGGIVEMAYSGGWSGPKTLTSSIANTSLSVCCWGNIQIRFYYQRVVNQIQEFCWSDGWVNGATIPTN